MKITLESYENFNYEKNIIKLQLYKNIIVIIIIIRIIRQCFSSVFKFKKYI